ncbi:T9SS type A sorting domain-containing protein, partial [Flavobacterium sp.]|uniref:T9SS type A sorting domain-containing protein n=1 Tax=Flavobacterium sp. TaxID=239 RepID=UPI0037531FF8
TYHGSINPCYITAMNATPTALYIRGHVSSCNPGSPIPNNENYYGSLNSYQPTALGCISTYLSKFNIDGQREWSTYYGANNISNANSIKTYENKVYFSGNGYGNLITTSGVFQENSFGENPPYLVQFTENNTRNWGTFCGANTGFPANGSSGADCNLNIDDLGGIYLSGSTALHTNIATSGAYQSDIVGQYNGFVCKFDNQGQKIWGTYYGGNATEYSMITHPYGRDNFYVIGTTTSTTGLTTPNCYQPNLITYDIDNGTPRNIFIAHFKPIPLATETFNQNSFSIYPNPTNGNFTVALKNTTSQNYTLDLFDMIGKKIISQKLNPTQTIITTSNLTKGVYIAKITGNENKSYNTKLIIN